MAWCFEKSMIIPLISLAQVRILAEGVTDPWGPCDSLPDELSPATRFTDAQIRRGLPQPGGFTLADCRCDWLHRVRDGLCDGS
jgi:hypothetical protein